MTFDHSMAYYYFSKLQFMTLLTANDFLEPWKSCNICFKLMET